MKLLSLLREFFDSGYGETRHGLSVAHSSHLIGRLELQPVANLPFLTAELIHTPRFLDGIISSIQSKTKQISLFAISVTLL